MRLSEAIRLGAMLRPQIRNDVFNGVGTCAFGAAYEAVGVLNRRPMDGPAEIWPWMGYVFTPTCLMVACPDCYIESSVTNVISAHLNDEHKWTREQIADWVETIEPKADPAPSMEHAASVVAVARTRNLL